MGTNTKKFLSILFSAILLSCTSITEPINPTLIQPTYVQDRAAELVTECTGVHINPTLINWYSVEGFVSEDMVLGKWVQPNTIFLAEEWVDNLYLNMHELIHYAIRKNDSDHTNIWWSQCLSSRWS